MRTCLILLVSLGFVPTLAAQDRVQFNRDIRPILSENCFYCHGPDAGHRQGELRLDDRASALTRKAVVPGKVSESELIARIISTDPDTLMPPPDSHKKLTPAQIATLQRWIEQGGDYQQHWSYEPPVRPSIPAGENPIDFLVSMERKRRQLTPAPTADRRTLIRRLYQDLIGLPPTPEAVQAFLNDPRPDAYTHLVESLLNNPHHGERMAMLWLDVVRFADTIGYHSDVPRNVWPYRDYVIRAFQQNMSFDRFTIEQLAGDLLPNPTTEQRIATAFNHLLLTTEEGGAQPKDYEARMLTDRVRAVGTVWLGQTFGCCQCHDHKFDPISTRSFYELGAFFADIQEPIVGRRPDGLLLASAHEKQKLEQLHSVASAAKIGRALIGVAAATKAAEKAERTAKSYQDTLTHCLTTETGRSQRVVRILPRGDWMNESGPVVQPNFPAYLPGGPKPDSRKLNRLDLARWIVSAENPLTARVQMNRLWKQFFGVALSKLTDDLGSQGEPPTHPELLDWLATEFVQRGWDIRAMIRVIVQSQTYQQSSTTTPEQLVADPENRWLARQGRFRLEAELIRDQALAVSGLLNRSIGGPSIKPYQPDGYWENLNFPVRQYIADRGAAQYRRGLYVWWQRSFVHPSMLAFDAPTREECAADRTRSNIPQQALVLLNDPTYVEAARVFAGRIVRHAPADTAGRIEWAVQQLLQRPATVVERQTLVPLVEKLAQQYQAQPAEAKKLLQVGFAPADAEASPAELAAWTGVSRVLLNYHESLTRE